MDPIRLPANNPRRRTIHARAAGTGFDVRAVNGAVEIDIYDYIDWMGVSPQDVRGQIRGASAITVNINSPGGDVFDGIAIYNDLVQHPAPVTVRVTGIAASAASLIAMAGDRIEIADNAFIMIHNAWTMAIGDRNEFQALAEMMTQVDNALARTYADRTGIERGEVAAMMDKETWIDGEQALERGFADAALGAVQVAAAFDLSLFANTPRVLRDQQPTDWTPRTRRDTEKWLMQDAGLSRSQAREILQACTVGPDGTQDAADRDSAETVEVLNRLRNYLKPYEVKS